ncbi:hypothetical protein [Pseudomonas sp. M30-35]|uniref:hypothetical protein n=1 Tax=Pseudomonas sp. M30-35 TaxID=1981174 RepID=UPI000B3C6F3F|nr:hypothetical protein [Pseudomonas sp. M30-35]ARU87762.1 hypothetical protein B9K09_07165 [Pseudomonas sp. M30-35]
MRVSIIMGAVLYVMGLSLHSMAFAEQAQAPAYSSATTPIGELLEDSRTRAVIDHHFPTLANHPQANMMRGMTLRDIQPFSDGGIQDEQLDAVDEDLAKLQ